ncbi:MAG: 16S rRNA (cytidine(1402)-2'-O)-methyltransferase, partial [Halothiobacillaceae bacterium]
MRVTDSGRWVVPGTLYVVATPLGNLADWSDRARAVLSQVDLIACEDTRHSGRLLDHFGIGTRRLSLHEHNEAERSRTLIDALQAGSSVALISDAGTPLVSDPGFVLVRAVRAAGHPVSPIPGPAALVAALSAAGLPSDRFAFEGFLPAKSSARRQRIERIASYAGTTIFYESPHRLVDMVNDLTDVLGEDRPAVLAAELTKRHERFFDGSLAQLAQMLVEGT